MLNRLSYLNSVFHYHEMRDQFVFILGKTHKMTILRRIASSDNYSMDGILMFSNRIFVSKDIYDSMEKKNLKTLRGEMSHFYYPSLDTRYTLDSRAKEMSLRGKKGERMMELEFDCLTYLEILNDRLHDDDSMVLEMRYHPNIGEYEAYMEVMKLKISVNFPSMTMNEKNISQVINNFDSTLSKIKDFYQRNFISTKHEDSMDTALSVKAMSTTVSTWMTGKLTEKNVDYWLRSRHDMFGREICSIMEWDSDKFDVNMVTEYDYKGVDYMKTPDYVLEMDDRVVLIDFAVTEADAGGIMDGKIRKYANLASGLSNHLQKQVDVEAVVFKINSEDTMLLPRFMANKRPMIQLSENIKEMKRIHRLLVSHRDYALVRPRIQNYSEDTEEQTASDFNELIKSIIKTVDLKNKKTRDMASSREKGRENSEFVKFEDMRISKEMEFDFNSESYENELIDSLRDKLFNEKYPKYLDQTINFDMSKFESKMRIMISDGEKLRQEFNKNPENSLSSVFKLPMIRFFKNHAIDSGYDFFLPRWEALRILEDGTRILKHNKFEETLVFSRPEEYNSKGIGIDMMADTIFFDEVWKYLSQDVEYETQEFEEGNEKMEFWQEFKSKKLAEVLTFWELMVENLCYLEGRRHIDNKRDGNSVFKWFKKYGLLIRKGSKITSQKQINFKVFIMEEDREVSQDKIFKSFNMSHRHPGYLETNWLSITVTDIRHFLKVKEVAMLILSDQLDKTLENNRMIDSGMMMMSKSYYTMMMILMEHRRGTSTTTQLNRYLLHSATSYITNTNKLLGDIMSDPVRSRLEAYCRVTQIRWMDLMIHHYQNINADRILNMSNTESSYDRFSIPSFFDLNSEVEFGILMNEIYVCNLLDKSSGFISHRLKRVVDKMETAEKHYQEVKESNISQGKVEHVDEILMREDEFHMFDRRYVVAATDYYFKERCNKALFSEKMFTAMTDVIDGAMMMTSSLESGPMNSKGFDYTPKIVKTRSFLTLYDQVEKIGTNSLLLMCSYYDEVDAVFTFFSKNQIGGAREILIQSVKLRIFVKLLETVSRQFCSMHEKEMLTKDSRKSEIQSSTMSSFKETHIDMKKKGLMSVLASLNSDASRWSPGFVMEHFLYFISRWPIDKELKNFLMTVVASFANKTMLTPEVLNDKWKKKPDQEKEDLPAVESFRRQAEAGQGNVLYQSGMGQGMFHFLSSIYHCVMDDYSDYIIEKCLKRFYNTSIKTVSLISSDDKTKMAMFVFGNIDTIENSMKGYLAMVDLLYRLSNIHTNWKKSALQFLITEFNSLFSIGKRMVFATIKDLYTACDVPDMSSPEEAVTFCNSNLRRMLENGVYIPTIQNAMLMNRNLLRRRYRLDKKVENTLCGILNCEKEDLPHQLGYYPLTMPVETLLYGLDIHMFKTNNSNELTRFYRNIFTADSSTFTKVNKKFVPFEENSSGKFWFELPTRLDKRLKEIKTSFLRDKIKLKPEEILENLDKYGLCNNMSKQDPKHFDIFSMSFFISMKRNYEMQETMPVHSIIRALSLSTSQGMVYPRLEDSDEDGGQTRNNNNHNFTEIRVMSDLSNMSNQQLLERKQIEKLKESMTHLDMIGFVKFIMSRESKYSGIHMYYPLNEVVKTHNRIERRLKDCQKMRKFSHPSKKTLRFYASDMNLMTEPKEMLEFMFNPESDFRNSVIQNFQSLSQFVFNSEDTSKILDNPFMFIKEFMKGSDYPIRAFMDYLNYIKKSLRFMKVDMISDFFDMGNMEDNLFSLYRTKQSPEYILEETENSNSDSDLEFLSKVSLNLYSGYRISATRENAENFIKIRSNDNSVSMARKLAFNGFNFPIPSLMVQSDKVKYSRETIDKKLDQERMMWTNLKCIMVCNIDNKRKVVKYHVDVNDLPNTLMFNEVYRSMAVILKRSKREFVNKGYHVTEDSSGYYSQLFENFVVIANQRIRYKVVPKYKTLKWELSLVVSTDKEFRESYYFKLCEDNYTVSIKSLKSVPMSDNLNNNMYDFLFERNSIVELDEYYTKMGWIKKDMFMSGKRSEEKKKNSEEVKDINLKFGLHDSLDKFSKLWADIKEESDSNEEGDDKIRIMYDMGRVRMENLSDVVRAMVDNVKRVQHHEIYDVEVSEESKRMSIVNLMDRAVTITVSQELELNNVRLIDLFKRVSHSPTRTSVLLQTILNTIQSMYNFSLSDGMSLMILNVLVKRVSNLHRINTNDAIYKKPGPRDIILPTKMSIITMKKENEMDEMSFLRQLDTMVPEEDKYDNLGYVKKEFQTEISTNPLDMFQSKSTSWADQVEEELDFP
nr:RNA-dependent RNA polymerase [Heterobasidion irregulare negative-stranded RNA virus 1]